MHQARYRIQGFTVLPGIIPPSLIEDLRRAAEPARALARKLHGLQAQRLQPIGKFGLDLQPFHHLRDLPELRAAIDKILGPDYQTLSLETCGMLFEPADRAYSTEWHRDWRDNVPGMASTDWDGARFDLRYFNQLNAPLYEDGCLWLVPGSHLRADTPAEIRRFSLRPIPPPALDGLTDAQRERACFDYARAMPGAVRVHLNPGDVAFYRNSLWHLGSYVPYQKRVTIHDYIDTPEFAEWRERVTRDAAQRRRLKRVHAALS